MVKRIVLIAGLALAAAQPAAAQRLESYGGAPAKKRGKKERAIDLLEQAVSLGWGDRAWMENDSDLEPLREEPRFQALLARIH